MVSEKTIDLKGFGSKAQEEQNTGNLLARVQESALFVVIVKAFIFAGQVRHPFLICIPCYGSPWARAGFVQPESDSIHPGPGWP